MVLEHCYLNHITPITSIFLQRKIEEVLKNFEPRARLHQVIADRNPDRNAYRLKIRFLCCMNIPNPVTVETFLERLR